MIKTSLFALLALMALGALTRTVAHGLPSGRNALAASPQRDEARGPPVGYWADELLDEL